MESISQSSRRCAAASGRKTYRHACCRVLRLDSQPRRPTLCRTGILTLKGKGWRRGGTYLGFLASVDTAVCTGRRPRRRFAGARGRSHRRARPRRRVYPIGIGRRAPQQDRSTPARRRGDLRRRWSDLGFRELLTAARVGIRAPSPRPLNGVALSH